MPESQHSLSGGLGVASGCGENAHESDPRDPWAWAADEEARTWRVFRRIDGVLAQLLAVVRQAHERIIGVRPVANGEKILSLYDMDIHVIVRGKSGADVEFRNSLFVAETASGFILDQELRREASPGDAKWLQERYDIMKEASVGKRCAAVGDRGFDSAGSRKKLAEEEAFNGLCPRDTNEMARRMREDEAFVGAQKRRAQTEGRIGILKNVFLQGVPRAKGFKNRELQVDWAVLELTTSGWLHECHGPVRIKPRRPDGLIAD